METLVTKENRNDRWISVVLVFAIYHELLFLINASSKSLNEKRLKCMCSEKVKEIKDFYFYFFFF